MTALSAQTFALLTLFVTGIALALKQRNAVGTALAPRPYIAKESLKMHA
jgi:hypothetical protein